MSLCVPKSDESVIVRDAELLSGEDVVTAERGDLVVVPPGRPHRPGQGGGASRTAPLGQRGETAARA
ncbi:hypothetical protein AB0P32_08275 [Streptomyces sp. NPDC085995]|uniref:hypothetical protein n=1 Tax=Streptomyces sp. NPDC085995 TaxID=3154861 RepID=UPI0034447DD5